MPPKKAASATKKAPAAAHPSYQDMIKEAVITLKERNGSSRQAVKKYVQANNNLGGISDAVFTNLFNRALLKGSETDVFARPKGTSGPIKLGQESKSTATKTKTASKTTAKPKATKAATTTTKKPAAKKATTAAAKPAATKKAPAKKTAAKANTSKKVKKTPTAAPAVEEKAPVVLGKTKSGRVTKSSAPQPTKATAPKKRAAPKKAAAKKSTTPKKA